MIESPDILARLRDLISRGGGILGVFDRSVVSRSRALELIDLLMESLPEEMEQARELIERREEIIEEARQHAGDIVDDAVRQAEHLVDADEVTRGAKQRAVVLRGEADAYVRDRLARLEIELERLLEEVRAGMETMGAESRNQKGDSDKPRISLDKL